MFRIMILMSLNCYFQSIQRIFEERDQRWQNGEHGRLGRQENNKFTIRAQFTTWRWSPRRGTGVPEDKHRDAEDFLEGYGLLEAHDVAQPGHDVARVFKDYISSPDYYEKGDFWQKKKSSRRRIRTKERFWKRVFNTKRSKGLFLEHVFH